MNSGGRGSGGADGTIVAVRVIRGNFSHHHQARTCSLLILLSSFSFTFLSFLSLLQQTSRREEREARESRFQDAYESAVAFEGMITNGGVGNKTS